MRLFGECFNLKRYPEPTSAAQLLPDSLSRRNNNFHQLSSLFLRRDPREILMALEPKITRSGAVEVETE